MSDIEQTDQKLRQFIQANRPTPPEPAADELQRIIGTIHAEQERKRGFWRAFAVPAMVAASLLLIIGIPLMMQEEQPKRAQQDNEALEIFLVETIGTLYSDNSTFESDTGVGGDWLRILEAN